MAESDSPTFAIMGSGGMGGYIGAKLTQAGYKVSFVARGAHLEAMNAHGFKIEGPDEGFVIKPIRATSDPGEIGPVDFVIFNGDYEAKKTNYRKKKHSGSCVFLKKIRGLGYVKLARIGW